MIEVGEYVRTRDGIIFRADEENKNIQINEFMNMRGEKDIVKHSKKITDLIKIGDLIKYKLKNLQNYSYGIVHITKDPRTLEETLRIGLYKLESVEILEILTKEQYEANCYNVGS